MQVSAEGRRLIKESEGLRLKAYPDPGTNGPPWTIGYGHTDPGIGPRTKWTLAQAEKALEKDIARHAAEVERLIAEAPTTQAQFDALASFDFNTGKLWKSTLLKKHKRGDYSGAAEEFGRWIYAGGRVLRGLQRRRAREANLYRQRSYPVCGVAR